MIWVWVKNAPAGCCGVERMVYSYNGLRLGCIAARPESEAEQEARGRKRESGGKREKGWPFAHPLARFCIHGPTRPFAPIRFSASQPTAGVRGHRASTVSYCKGKVTYCTYSLLCVFAVRFCLLANTSQTPLPLLSTLLSSPRTAQTSTSSSSPSQQALKHRLRPILSPLILPFHKVPQTSGSHEQHHSGPKLRQLPALAKLTPCKCTSHSAPCNGLESDCCKWCSGRPQSAKHGYLEQRCNHKQRDTWRCGEQEEAEASPEAGRGETSFLSPICR